MSKTKPLLNGAVVRIVRRFVESTDTDKEVVGQFGLSAEPDFGLLLYGEGR